MHVFCFCIISNNILAFGIFNDINEQVHLKIVTNQKCVEMNLFQTFKNCAAVNLDKKALTLSFNDFVSYTNPII